MNRETFQQLGPFLLLFVAVACVCVATFAPDAQRAKELMDLGKVISGAALMAILPGVSRTIVGGERSTDRHNTIERPKGG